MVLQQISFLLLPHLILEGGIDTIDVILYRAWKDSFISFGFLDWNRMGVFFLAIMVTPPGSCYVTQSCGIILCTDFKPALRTDCWFVEIFWECIIASGLMSLMQCLIWNITQKLAWALVVPVWKAEHFLIVVCFGRFRQHAMSQSTNYSWMSWPLIWTIVWWYVESFDNNMALLARLRTCNVSISWLQWYAGQSRWPWA